MKKTSWKFYLNAEEALNAMLRSCERAKTYIDIEQYIFADDEMGRAYAQVLMAKARAGVRVRILADAVGSTSLFVSDLSTELSEAGVQVQFFNQIRPWWPHTLSEWFLRDHRKLMIIDGVEAWTGGVGICSFMNLWRDTHLMIRGPIAEQFQSSFDRFWLMARRGKRFISFDRLEPTSGMQLLTSAPKRHQRYIYYAILDTIKNAQKYIHLSTPYFVPNRKLFRALKRAVRRGVEVKLLVPKETDHEIVSLASSSYFWLTLRAGIKIYRYEPSMMHAKTMVVDDTWAMVGSCNLDNLSLLLNYEDALISTEPTFAQEVEKQFTADLAHAPELTQSQWHSRRIADKFLESLTWPIHRLL